MIFEKATMLKLRFTYKGIQGVEDLWDLDVVELDQIYSKLKADQKASSCDSLLNDITNEDRDLRLRIAIVKRIFDVKQSAKAERIQLAEKREQYRRVREIIAQRNDEKLANLPMDQLEDMAKDLDPDQ